VSLLFAMYDERVTPREKTGRRRCRPRQKKRSSWVLGGGKITGPEGAKKSERLKRRNGAKRCRNVEETEGKG